MPTIYNFTAVLFVVVAIAWLFGSVMGGLVSWEVADLIALLDDRPALELSSDR